MTRYVALHGKPSLLGLIGYLILSSAVLLAFYGQGQNSAAQAENAANIANERADRSVELNHYLAKQCARDVKKDAVFIGILTRSIAQARASTRVDPAIRNAYVHKTAMDIAAIRAIDRECVADIPPPIPKHTT